MFELNIRFQLAAICIMLIIIIDFIKTPHLKLLSTKLYKNYMVAVIINLLLDITTVYTITHLNTVSPEINRLCHQLFIGSVVCCMFLHYLYVMALGSDQKRFRRKELVYIIIPMVISVIVIVCGRLNYHVTGRCAYSYGQMAYFVYVCGIIYLALSFRESCRKNSKLTNSQRISIKTGLIIWVIALLVQILFPQYLLSGMGFVLLTLSVYFSFENQHENYDTETETFNRNAFHRMMSEYFENGENFYLVDVVLENYERINTMLGHDVGVEALRCIKNHIKNRYGDEIYHSRSNVFSIFITDNIDQSIAKAELLRDDLLNNEFADASLRFHMHIMDVRKYTTEKDEVYQLINFMASKCNSAINVINYLDENIVKEKYRRDRIELLLANAVENNGFEMYYQPIYWPAEGRIKSAEALIRLKSDEELGYISPEEFIPIAEEKGLIMDIGESVINMVSEFIGTNKDKLESIDYIEVNLSAIQTAAPGISKQIKNAIDKYSIDPQKLNFEITETATINFTKVFEENISRLKDMGFSFSMDDFGTGFSNLEQMSRINYDLVKIDKCLIWPVFYDKSEKSERLLSSVIAMLKNVNTKIVAEGVETKEMVDYLADKGVEHLQGFYFSKPINGDAFIELINGD